MRFESIRSIVGLGIQHKLQLHQMDVSTAFLHGELTEEVYMRQPEGFIEPGKEHLICRLKRSIYGLKQSPRCWNHTLHTQLKTMGFKQTSSDPCLYVYLESEGVPFLIAVYVDDIVLGGRSEAKMTAVKKELSHKFEMKDRGPLHHFLGVKIIQDQLAGVIWSDGSLQKIRNASQSAHLSILTSSLSLVRAQKMCVTSRCTRQLSAVCCISLPKPDLILPMLLAVLLVSVPNRQRNIGHQ